MENRRNVFILLLFAADVSGIVATMSPSVVIVGAGASGIAALTKLLEKGITNVTVLEAMSRIGGRIHSVELGGGLVDVGAEFVLKKDGDIAYDLIEKCDFMRDLVGGNKLFYPSNREEVDPAFIEKMSLIVEKVLDKTGEIPEGLSIGEYYTKKLNSSISKLNLTDSKQIKYANGFMDYLRHLTESTLGQIWSEASANDDFEANDVSYMSFNGHGYKTIVDVMMKKYPKMNNLALADDKILLQKIVTKILWDKRGDNDVTVKCSDGTIYKADYVIFTPSLGVMKKQHSDLFEPHLPAEKVNAIQNLGAGALMKLFLHFENTWWPKSSFAGFNFIWSSEDEAFAKENGKGWVLNLAELHPVIGVPNVLSGSLCIDNVPDVEAHDDKTFQEGIMFVLKKFLEPTYQVPQPDVIIRSNWTTNSHILRTTVYETLASRQDKTGGIDNFSELAKPLMNSNSKASVLFAGDATHPTLYGSVNGAVSRGYFEANRVYHLSQMNE